MVGRVRGTAPAALSLTGSNRKRIRPDSEGAGALLCDGDRYEFLVRADPRLPGTRTASLDQLHLDIIGQRILIRRTQLTQADGREPEDGRCTSDGEEAGVHRVRDGCDEPLAEQHRRFISVVLLLRIERYHRVQPRPVNQSEFKKPCPEDGHADLQVVGCTVHPRAEVLSKASRPSRLHEQTRHDERCREVVGETATAGDPTLGWYIEVNSRRGDFIPRKEVEQRTGDVERPAVWSSTPVDEYRVVIAQVAHRRGQAFRAVHVQYESTDVLLDGLFQPFCRGGTQVPRHPNFSTSGFYVLALPSREDPAFHPARGAGFHHRSGALPIGSNPAASTFLKRRQLRRGDILHPEGEPTLAHKAERIEEFVGLHPQQLRGAHQFLGRDPPRSRLKGGDRPNTLKARASAKLRWLIRCAFRSNLMRNAMRAFCSFECIRWPLIVVDQQRAGRRAHPARRKGGTVECRSPTKTIPLEYQAPRKADAFRGAVNGLGRLRIGRAELRPIADRAWRAAGCVGRPRAEASARNGGDSEWRVAGSSASASVHMGLPQDAVL